MMSLCPVCGRVYCDHPASQRGQTREEMDAPLTEDELTEKLKQILSEIKLDELKLTQCIKREFLKYQKFMNVFDEQVSGKQKDDIDQKRFAIYMLEEGSREEKRELLNSIPRRCKKQLSYDLRRFLVLSWQLNEIILSWMVK